MSYHGLAESFDVSTLEIKGNLASANAQAANEALNKMRVPAEYAGPLSQAEQSAFLTVIESGAAGKLPSPSQFASSLKTATLGVATVAAAGACGPAAPLCGAAATYVGSKLLSSFIGSGSPCAIKINGACAHEYYGQMKARGQSLCPTGDADCRKKVAFLTDGQLAIVNSNYSKSVEWQSRCSKPWDPHFAPPLDCYSQCSGKNSFAQVGCVSDLRSKGYGPVQPPGTPVIQESAMMNAIYRIVMEARYKAEYEYIKAVDAQTASLKAKVLPQCKTAGCRTQASGILGEGAYEAAQALRSPGGGATAAKRVLDQAMLQAQGVVEQSKQVSSLEGQVSEQRDESRKMILGGLALAAFSVGFVAWRKNRVLFEHRKSVR